MELYLFFHEIAYGGSFDTLSKVILPSFPISDETRTEESIDAVTPVLRITKGKYPFSMGCVHLDSKVYFFGGFSRNPYEIKDDMANIGCDFTNQVYPRGAFVLDLTGNDLVLSEIPPMETGKPCTFGFVASGMIYVIGGKVRRSCSFSDDKIKFFERFDPISREWKVLNDTPLRAIRQCVRASVVENQHKVLICAWRDIDVVHLVYDFLNDTWDSESLLMSCNPAGKPYSISHISACNLNGNGHYLYGLGSHPIGPLPVKLGPLKELKIGQLRMLSSVEVSTHDGGNVCVIFGPIGLRTLTTMVYLGDGHFCYVSIAQHLPGDFGDDSCDPCPQTHVMFLTIFKDLSSPTAIQQSGSSFEAKILCVKKYVMNTNYYGSVNTGGCFVVCGSD